MTPCAHEDHCRDFARCGGSGKTTVTLNLAIAASLRKQRVVVADLDPQQSAARWSRLREGDVPGHGPNLAERARLNGTDLVLIDTAPKSESAALVAAKLADSVLIPCQPPSLDLDAIADTVSIVQLAKRQAAFVLNNCRAASSLADQADEADEALRDYRLWLAPVRLGSRVAYVKSLAEGKGVLEFEPKGAAAAEIRKLYVYTTQQGGLLPCPHVHTSTS